MQLVPYRAFGYVFTINYHNVGDTFYVEVPPTGGRCLTYHVKGAYQIEDANGSQTFPIGVPEAPAADQNWHDQPDNTKLFLTCLVDGVIFCYDPNNNGEVIPTFTNLRLLAGSSTMIPNNSKLLLMEGSLTINNIEYSGPNRINITSGDFEAVANSNCYGLFIP